jgi:hypothetical protein
MEVLQCISSPILEGPDPRMIDQEGTETRDPGGTESRPSVAPTLQLSRGGLIVSLLAMVATGLGVYALFPESVGGPPLPVEVRLDRQPVETPGGSGAVVTDVVVVDNVSDHDIPRLSLEINGQYLLMRQSPLAKGESVVLPQRVFTDKRSSQRFDPTTYDVQEVTVSGQLPSRARGMSRFEFDGERLVNVE